MEEDLKPEIDDTVTYEYSETFDKVSGRMRHTSCRGKIVRVFKSGGIAVRPEGGAPILRLKAGEFDVVAKAG